MEATRTPWKQRALLLRLADGHAGLLTSATRPPESRPVRQPQRRLAAEQVNQLIAEYQAGDSLRELADRWDLHRTTVAAHLHRAGVEVRQQGVPDDKVPEASQLYGDGWSLARLGQRYGCSADTVRLALVKAGVMMRRPWERG